MFYRFFKRLLWPGPDYGTRCRYALRSRLLKGDDVSTLDVGCGNGCLTLAAASVGRYALGISNQIEYLKRAEAFRDRMGMSAARCEFRDLNVYELGRAGLPQFDQIVLFEVLEHLYDDETAVRLCADRLTNDGWLHITVPNRDNHVHFEGVQRREDGRHVRHGYDFASLEALLRRHGLEPIDRLGVGGIGTVLGFLAVVNAGRLPGIAGKAATVLAFFVAWPFVQLLNLLPCKPWSLYVLAAKRSKPIPPSELSGCD